MFDGLKKIIITMGEDEFSIKFEFHTLEDLIGAMRAMQESAKETDEIKERVEKIAENLAKMIKETMEKAPDQIIHFGEITKDGGVRVLTPEEFADKYLKEEKDEGKERRRRRKEEGIE